MNENERGKKEGGRRKKAEKSAAILQKFPQKF